MKNVVIVAAALFAAVTALPVSAQQANCTKRPEVIRQLAKQYSEALVAIGLSSNGRVVEVLSSKKNSELDHDHYHAQRHIMPDGRR